MKNALLGPCFFWDQLPQLLLVCLITFSNLTMQTVSKSKSLFARDYSFARFMNLNPQFSMTASILFVIIYSFSYLILRSSVITSILSLMFFIIPGYYLLTLLKSRFDSYIETLCLAFLASTMIISSVTFILALNAMSELLPLMMVGLSSILWVAMHLCQRNKKLFSYEPNSAEDFVANRLPSTQTIQRKYEFLLMFGMLIFFFVALAIRNPSQLPQPDEYHYMTASRELLDNLPPFSPDAFLHILESKFVYLIILHGFQNLSTATFASLHVLSLFYCIMLFAVTFFIGNRISHQTGLIAAVLMAFNPLIWYWSFRIMPDILTSVLAVLSLIYITKAFQTKDDIHIGFFLIGLLCCFLSILIKANTIVWLLPFVFYAASGATRENQTKLKFWLWSVGPFVLVALIIFIALILAPYLITIDLARLINDLSIVLHFSLEDLNNFLFHSYYGGAWAVWIYPHYYTTAVAGLILIGFMIFLIRRPPWISIREVLLWLTCIVTLLAFFSIASNIQVARNIFPCYPLLMVLAASAFRKKLGKSSLLLIPILAYSILFLFTSETGVALIGELPVEYLIPSRLMWIVVILYKIVEGLNSKISINSWHLPLFGLRVQSAILVSILVVCSLYMYGFTTYTWYADGVTDESLGLPQAGEWFQANSTPNRTIITPAYVQLKYYLPNYNIIHPPTNNSLFLDAITQHTFDYLVLFTDSRLRIDNWVFLRSYVNNIPPNMTQLVKFNMDSVLYVIYGF